MRLLRRSFPSMAAAKLVLCVCIIILAHLSGAHGFSPRHLARRRCKSSRCRAISPRPRPLVRASTVGCEVEPGDPVSVNNLVTNADFAIGIAPWVPFYGTPSLARGGTDTSNPYLIMADRGAASNGPFYPVTFIQPDVIYQLTAWVRVGTTNSAAALQATLKTTDAGGVESYTRIGEASATPSCWTILNGTFSRPSVPTGQTGIYFESASATTDIWLDSVSVVLLIAPPPAPPPPPIRPPPAPPAPPPGTFYTGNPYKCAPIPGPISLPSGAVNIIFNPGFERGLQGWDPIGTANLSIQAYPGNTNPFLVASGRDQSYAGPSQLIDPTQFKPNTVYALAAWVKVSGKDSQFVKASFKVDGDPSGTQYLCFANGIARSGCWTLLEGALKIGFAPTSLTLYFEGPDVEVDLWIDSISLYAINATAERKEQDASIDKIRKRDVVLKIVDKSGKPVKGASVKVEQIASDFPWGAAISYNITYDKKYQEYFLGRKFNLAVFENELKWDAMQPTPLYVNYTKPDEMLAWARKNRLRVRGHNIFWEDPTYNSEWVKALAAPQLRTALENRLSQLLPHYRGKFIHYDVDNEILTSNLFPSRLPNDSIQAFFFKRAHQLDSKPLLFMNEYGTTEACGNPQQNTDNYLNTLALLQAAGAPITGLGVQGHFGYGVPIPHFIKVNVDKLATSGLPIWVTELDFTFANENDKAEYMETALRSYFSNPNIAGIVLWQTSDRCDLRCITNSDYVPKPASDRYDKMRALWNTKVSITTDKEGKARFRGFFGKYRIIVSAASGLNCRFSGVSVKACKAPTTPVKITLTCKRSKPARTKHVGKEQVIH